MRRTDPGPYLRRAAEALEAGDVTAAERGCLTALKAAPNHPGALNLLGMTKRQAGDLDAAEVVFRRATLAAPRYAEAWINLGRTLALRDQPEKAKEAFERALKARPAFLAGQIALADTMADAGDAASARTLLETAAREHPQSVEACIALARLLQASGDMAGAIDALTEALSRDPASGDAWLERSARRLEAGDAEGALSDAEAAMDYADAPARAVACRIRALQALDRAGETEAWTDPEKVIFRLRPDLAAKESARDPEASSALITAIEDAVERLLPQLPDDPQHPFFGRRPRSFEVATRPAGNTAETAAEPAPGGGTWGTGFCVLPIQMETEDAGCTVFFGEPADGFPPTPKLAGVSIHLKAGEMILFPSYLLHRVAVADAENSGSCIAFDIDPT